MAAILLVEDDVLLADCYRRWLTASGHAVQHVLGAQAALDALDGSSPDVILLDILLHDANGIQFLHILRSHIDIADIPVIICSNALPKQILDLSAYGVRAMLDKSLLNRRSLAAAIAGVL